MALAVKNAAIYEFDDFRLVPGENLLLRNGEPVALNRKAFNVLSVLVERNGHLVEKSEILDLVWQDSFVEEGSLSKAIWYVRTALGDTSKERFIQTVPRRGYRFVFPVSVVMNGSGAFRLADLKRLNELDDVNPLPAEDQRTNGRNGPLEAEVAGSDEGADLEQTLPAKPSRYRKLRRAAVYAGTGVALVAAIALFAALYGSYTAKAGHLRDRGTKNEVAYSLYQQAENLSHSRLRTDLSTAMDDLNQAVALDPNFARAWAAKAHLHRHMSTRPGADQNEQYIKSMDALGNALAIDPNLSEGYSALCLNKIHYEFDWTGAESACKRALELDASSPVGHDAYAYFLYSRGRFDESVAESKRATELEPLSYLFQQRYALALYFSRRYEEEEAQWERLIELNPTHGFIYTRLFINLMQQGKDDKAFDYLIEKLKEDQAGNETVEGFRSAYAASGRRGVTIERIKHPETESFTGPFDVACLYATVGDKDKAFAYLEKAYQEHNYRMSVLEVEPQLDPLRDDPRYADLVRRVETQN